MRVIVCALVAAAVLAALPGLARADAAAAFWKGVQARCDATATTPASDTAKRIAKIATGELTGFDGHAVDSNGRMFHFGQTEAEQSKGNGGDRPTRFGDLAWWQVMKYWHALYGDDIGDKLEALGYEDASKASDANKDASIVRGDVGDLLRAVDGVTDPAQREILREAILRAVVIDTPWSAAFVSYVVKQAGVPAKAFEFANAHRVYIYDAFAVSAAEHGNAAPDKLYRACPLSTRPRAGDLLCFEREPKLKDASDAAVREVVRSELGGPAEARTVRRTHCDVVAHVDTGARKVYVIGGNIYQSVTVKKLNLRGDMTVSALQKGDCGGPGYWTLPESAREGARLTENCSLNDKKWFVLLQVR
jgi:hypothetical protein